MYNRRSYFRGGRVNYGFGGSVLTFAKNLAEGKRLGSGAFDGVGQAALTPGSGITAGFGLAKQLGQNIMDPNVNVFGRPQQPNVTGPGQQVPGQQAQPQQANPLLGVTGQLAQNFLGQAHGGKVNLIKAQGGVNTGTAGEEEEEESIPGYAADPSLGFAAGTMGRRTSGGGRPEELMDFASFYKRQTGEDMPGIGSFPENYNQGSSDRNLDPSLYYPDFDQEAMDKANQMYKPDGRGGWVDFDARDSDAYPVGGSHHRDSSGAVYGRARFHPSHQGMDNARKASSVYDRVKEQEAAYRDYMKSWSPTDTQKKPEYSFEEGPGGEGGTLKITNAQRQSDGGMVYAQGGTRLPDKRSWMQMLADELSQVGSGIAEMSRGRDQYVLGDFQRGYRNQEKADAARQASGQSGRVDALGSAVGAGVGALLDDDASQARLYYGNTLNPFSVAVDAYERARMTDDARNATRQFAGGRNNVRLMRRR